MILSFSSSKDECCANDDQLVFDTCNVNTIMTNYNVAFCDCWCFAGVGMHQDGLLDEHKDLPCQDYLVRQAREDSGDPGIKCPVDNYKQSLQHENCRKYYTR